jgi:hypothetical protein
MATIEDISKKMDEMQTSIETTEGLLAQVLDKQKEIPKKENDKNDNNGFDEKTLNNLTQRFERTLTNKLGNENVFTILEGYKLHFERFFVTHLQPAKNITVFGGKDALVNYNRILLGSGIVLIIYAVFKFLPGYLLEKQKLDDDFLVYKTYAETHLLLEFFNNGSTKDYDKLINSIKNQSPEFKNQFKKLVEYWNEEHEKANLKMQIQKNQQRLKELEK